MKTSSIKITLLASFASLLAMGVASAEEATDFTGQDFTVDQIVTALDIPIRGIDANCSANVEKMEQLTRGISVNPATVDEVPALKPMKTASVTATFAINSAELTDDSRSHLAKIAAAMQTPQLAAQCFQVAGHTCDLGDEAYNLDLSRRRADAVKTYLIGQGIEATRIVTTGYGEMSPLDAGQTESARQKNRRVDLGALPPVALEYQ